MKNFVNGLGRLYREYKDVQSFFGKPVGQRRLVFYSEDEASFNQFEGYVDALLDAGHSVDYLTSDHEDSLFNSDRENLRLYYVNRFMPSVMPRVDSEVMVLTMPELGKHHVKRPKPSCDLVYVFHSLNSIHEVYQDGAFDHYDHFFCTGPHHRRELEMHFHRLGRRCPQLYDVGYYKLDRVHQAYEQHRRTSKSTKILIAPSWGDGNLLEEHGVSIIHQLLAMGLDVVVRPHPCFFLPIYPRGIECVNQIESKFKGEPNFTLEKSIVSELSFYESDLMISDFSGAAFEYALGTGRPVLFVDVARKTKNKNWRDLGLDTFEDKMRYQVGEVVEPTEIERIGEVAERLLSSGVAFVQRISDLRKTAVYNFNASADAGASVIDDLLANRS